MLRDAAIIFLRKKSQRPQILLSYTIKVLKSGANTTLIEQGALTMKHCFTPTYYAVIF